jgi:hypothetical protein
MTKATNNKVNAQDITRGEPVVLNEKHPDTVFLRPGEYLQKGSSSLVIKGNAAGIAGFSSGLGGNGLVNTENPEERKPLFPVEVVHKWGPRSLAYPIILPDTPDLSDIVSINFTRYYDVTNKLRIKAEIKIKNSSVKKDSVIGVDARVFNVGGQ